MSLAEHQARLTAQLSAARSRAVDLEQALKTTNESIQRLIGALAFVEQLERASTDKALLPVDAPPGSAQG